MRYLDRTNCKRMSDRGEDREIKTLGSLTREATRIAENNGLGLLKTSHGGYRIIRACGLGAYTADLQTLKDADDFLKHLDKHASERL